MNLLNSHPDSYYVSAGWLIDGTGGPILKRPVIRVSGGTIISIRLGRPAESDKEQIIDFSDYTILPGLVDSHVHLSMSGCEEPKTRQRQRNASFKEAKAVIFKNLMDHLNSGVVAVRDGGDYRGHTLRYKLDSQDMDSIPITCAMAGKAWHAEGRYGSIIGRPPDKGEDLARSIIRKNHGADHVKIVNSGLNSLSCYGKETEPQFSIDELSAAVRMAEGHGLRTMVHANGRRAVREAIEAGCHSIEHGFFMGDDNLKRMADKQITWVPTLFTMKALCKAIGQSGVDIDVVKKNLEHQMGQVARAGEYGVTIAVGTDSGSLGVNHGESMSEEIGLFISAGLSIEEIVKCATINSGKLVGSHYIGGMLISGMPATFIVTRGSPEKMTDCLNRPKAVFVQGRAWGTCI